MNLPIVDQGEGVEEDFVELASSTPFQIERVGNRNPGKYITIELLSILKLFKTDML